MCGLIYVQRKDGRAAAHMVAKRYHRQRARGSDGFGYLAINGTVKARRATIESKALEKLEQETDSEILFHHRLPTSTVNVVDATHPILVGNPALQYTYYVAHNGVISNADELKVEHEKRGLTYRTTVEHITRTRNYETVQTQFNDSEALAIDFALTLEGKQEAMQANGSIAFLALRLERKTKRPLMLYYGRNGGSPLTIENQKDFTAIVSEGGAPLSADTLYSYSYETGQTEAREMKIGRYSQPLGLWYDYVAYNGYGGYNGDDADMDGITAAEIEAELWELYRQKEELETMRKIAVQSGDRGEERGIMWSIEDVSEAIETLENRLTRSKTYDAPAGQNCLYQHNHEAEPQQCVWHD